MSNVSSGFAYEREVKKHFTDAGWGCTRAAHSASIMDLIAFRLLGVRLEDGVILNPTSVFTTNGYRCEGSGSRKIPLNYLASKIEKKYIKHVYWDHVFDNKWVVILMQCKIKKRR